MSAVSGAAALVLAAAGGAAAHVTVHSADAKPGSSGTLIFKVPNEQANASTTKVEIDLPTDTLLSDVSATAPAGWKADVSSTSIVFSGGQITGDNDQEFPVRVGTLPSSGTVVFKALQTYSDGNVVRWIEQSTPGLPEPAHPAPTLDLSNPNKVDNAAEDAHGAMSGMDRSTMGTMKAATATPAPTSSSSSSSSSSSTSSSSPKSVKAGSGGQAAAGSGVPVAPLPFVLAGLAAAAYGARRLIRH